jgi:ketosteroid isomerase-like protein
MRKVSLLFAMTLMALSLHAQSDGGVLGTIKQNEEQWAAAEKAGDYAKVSSMLASLFVHMGSDGTMANKEQFLASIRGTKWEVNEVSEIQVMVHGDTAIATGTWAGKGTRANGQAIDAHEHWIDTWMKSPDGKWQCVASASAPWKPIRV